MRLEERLPRSIEKNDVEAVPLEVGDTEIILQRHGKYERDPKSQRVGKITEEGLEDVERVGRQFFESLFEKIPKPERQGVRILVVGSDTRYLGGGQRSLETAEQTIQALEGVMKELGLSEEQILNRSGRFRGEKGVRPVSKLREPHMFQNSPEFVSFLKEKYGDLGKDFWIAFESDSEKSAREVMGAEGPDEIVDRLKRVLETFKRYSRMYHKKNPGQRLIIWATTHYDTISPFVKRELFKVGKKEALGVDYTSGIVIKVNRDGSAKARIAGKEYEMPIN